MIDMPVPRELLPKESDWASPSRRTYMLSDHPSVIMQELCFQMESYWGPAFVAGFLRQMAHKFDARQRVYEQHQDDRKVVT